MVFYIMFFIFSGCTLIFNKNTENVFIFLASITFYKMITQQKNYRHMIYAFFISILILNITITFGFRNYFYEEEIHPLVEKEETLVLLVYEGESKSYNIRDISTQIYFEDNLRTIYNMIFRLNEYKSYYDEVGQSEFKEESIEISESLKERLGNDYIVMNTYLYTQPYFENMMNVALQEGYKDIIICPMFITEGLNYEMLISRYEDIDLHNSMVNIIILEQFNEDEELVTLYVDGILEKAKKNDNDIGVILLGLEDSNNSNQDVHIRESIKVKLDEQKLENDLDIEVEIVDINGNVEKSIQEILEYGIDELYVVTPTVVIDNIVINNMVAEIENMVDARYTSLEHFEPNEKKEFISENIYYIIEEINQ